MKRARRTLVIVLLARLGWQRDPSTWAVRCRDGHGGRDTLRVHLHVGGVRLASSRSGQSFVLTPLDVGRLRSALREAVFDHAALTSPRDSDNDDQHSHAA